MSDTTSRTAAMVREIAGTEGRLAADQRRSALVDAAAEMVSSGHSDDVSMESVAERAGVSRALVYKHFANRRNLLDALYERESSRLHEELAVAVSAETTMAGMLRALVDGALRAQAERGATFAALASVAGRTPRHGQVQSKRDEQTLRFFARQAEREFDMMSQEATAAVSIILSSISVVLAVWRQNPTPERAVLLSGTYVQLAIGGLASFGRESGPH